MGLVSRLFSEVVVAFFRCFKSVDATGIKLLEFGEIVDPMGAQGCGVADELAPTAPRNLSSMEISLKCIQR